MNKKLDFIKDKECWVVRADSGKSVDAFRKFEIAALDFGIQELTPEGLDVFKDNLKTYEILKKFQPNMEKKYPNWWGSINMFFNYMKVDDIVISPTENSSFLMVGTILTDVFFEKGDEKLPHSIKRKVVWLDGVFKKDEFPISLKSLQTPSTCFYIDKKKGLEDYDYEEESNETFLDTIIDGCVYLMKSNSISGLFKIGYAEEDAEKRCSALSTCLKYGWLNLEVIGYVKCKTHRRLEKALHNHFAPVRMCVENGCYRDTELFLSPNIPVQFKEYVELLQKHNHFEITEIKYY